METQKNKDGTFKKGHTLSKGRPPGSRNKAQNKIRQFFSDFVTDHMEELDEAFKELDAKDKFKFIIDLSKFIIPNLKAIEFGNVLDELTEEDFDILLTKIKEEYLQN